MNYVNDDIRALIAKDLPEFGTTKVLAQQCLDTLESALGGLHSLGVRLQVGTMTPPGVIEWPKMLYRDETPELLVNSQDEEVKALAEGYRLTPLPDPAAGAPTPAVAAPAPVTGSEAST